ncbi:sensor domain-containing phosphodiesterase [Erwinia endophytica]|uniref:sensor domain-containing phosphodiesterase n=1 Tax=Erwinia endophytica TaxID=1563158 RepID=UPI001265E30C|nr:EAL domain-containing protein [Erwinia endophytica]KAB8309535.1 sensor domain-containing phosphodiesterase [Erwinia endophytica]
MRISPCLSRFYHSSWGLALLLPLILMPVSSMLSVRLWVPGGYVYLIYLPLALMIAMLQVYDWGAMPGIILGLITYYFHHYPPAQAAIIVCVFISVLVCGWAGYRIQVRRRWSVDYGDLRMMPIRLFWLSFLIPTLLVFATQLMVSIGMMPLGQSVFPHELFSLHTLLNWQSALLSCLTMVQICYLFIRCLRNPRFIRLARQRIIRQVSPGVKTSECLLWIGLVAFLLVLLTQFNESKHNLLSTDYGLPLLLPLMLWAAMRFGYLCTSLSWALLLVVLYQLRDRFLHPTTDPYNLAVLSANLLIFSLTILFMSAISTRQRGTLAMAKAAALNDPVMNMPNLRALSHALEKNSRSTLCFLSIPDLDRLSRTYGLRLRIQYKRSLASHLKVDLLPGEEVYQLPGFDLVMRLKDEGHLERIENIAARLKDYYLNWEGLPIQPQVGLSYCSVRPPVTHLYELLGEMSGMAGVSLTSGVVENLQQNAKLSVQRLVTQKITLLNDIQLALKTEGFQLTAQKICGVRGDDYYEITPGMKDSQGDEVKPELLHLVVNEFALHWNVDRWVLVQLLTFINQHRATLPGLRFSMSLFAATLCRPQLAREVEALLREYNVESWQLIFDVEESPSLTDYSWGNRTIAQLRNLGCRVAIDDFGRGYASYARLKELQVDMLKINGNFVRNMTHSSLDYQIIESTCVIARLKKMQILAKCVEVKEEDDLLRGLGVDYLQGPLYGQPCLLEEIADRRHIAARRIVSETEMVTSF